MKKLSIQHLIHDKNHHYKLSINPHCVGVVLLERKDLKRARFIHYKKNCKRRIHEKDVYQEALQTEGLIIIFS